MTIGDTSLEQATRGRIVENTERGAVSQVDQDTDAHGRLLVERIGDVELDWSVAAVVDVEDAEHGRCREAVLITDATVE